MKVIHKNTSRWIFDFGWLQAAHSFSFWEYFNPEKMGFWTLRVINDDIIAAWQWFWTHPHNNMEIITIVLSWALEHKDSMGNSWVIQAWEVQAMSAGSWVLHSEFNPSHIQETNSFQIWIQTKKNDIQPQYNQKKFLPENRKNNFQLLVSPNKSDKNVFINQDAYISRVDLEKWRSIFYKKHLENNGLYIMVISWNGIINGENLYEKDAIWITNENNIEIISESENFDVLILEVPMQ